MEIWTGDRSRWLRNTLQSIRRRFSISSDQEVPRWDALPNLLTIGAAARILKVHRNTLRLWDQRGTLRAVRLGRRGDRRYDREQVRQLWLQSQWAAPKIPTTHQFLTRERWRQLRRAWYVPVGAALVLLTVIVLSHGNGGSVVAGKPGVQVLTLDPTACRGWEGASKAERTDLDDGAVADQFSADNAALYTSAKSQVTEPIDPNTIAVGTLNSPVAAVSCEAFDSPAFPSSGSITASELVLSFHSESSGNTTASFVVETSRDGQAWTTVGVLPVQTEHPGRAHVALPTDLDRNALARLHVRLTPDVNADSPAVTAWLDGVAVSATVNVPLVPDPKKDQQASKKLDSLVSFSKDVYRRGEHPVVTLPKVQTHRNALLSKQSVSWNLDAVELVDSGGRVMPALYNTQDTTHGDSVDQTLRLDTTSIHAGKYTLRVTMTNSEGGRSTIEKEFLWGVLAVNLTRSAAGSAALDHVVAIGVLDDAGLTICDATVDLTITSPKGEQQQFSTDRNTVVRTTGCVDKGVTNEPDYAAKFNVAESGVYHLKLEAKTAAGKRTLEDNFLIDPTAPVEVQRYDYPTRIYPLAKYPVRIAVTTSEDYFGNVAESVPAEFAITAVQADGEVQTDPTDPTRKLIVWPVDWKRGQTHFLEYTFDAPDISPALFLTGPLTVGGGFATAPVFVEPRSWQIASDAAVSVGDQDFAADQADVIEPLRAAYRRDETVDIKVFKSGYRFKDGKVKKGLAKKQPATVTTIEVVNAANRAVLDVATTANDIIQSDRGLELLHLAPPGSDFRPGQYILKLSVTDGTTTSVEERTFNWGVLSVNVRRSIEKPNTATTIGLAVLNKYGHTECDVPITLVVTDPSGQSQTLTTADGTISKGPNCSNGNVTNDFDYVAPYTTGAAGIYALHMTSNTGEGDISIDDSFEVRDSVAFDIERTKFSMRIWPYANYDQQFTIVANADYAGSVTETVPTSFDISTISDGGTVAPTADAQSITWAVDWKAGETHTLGYTIDFPDVSPEFYLLGPLTIGTFQEARQWQVASDATCTASTTGNWSTNATWTTGQCNSSYPGAGAAGDIVVIPTGQTVTLDVSPAFTIATLAVNGNSGNLNWKTLTPCPCTLQTTSTVTIGAPTNAGNTHGIDIKTGTLISGGLLSITSGASTRKSQLLSADSSTLTASAGITFTGTAPTLNNSAPGTINLTGTMSAGGTVTIDPGTTLKTLGTAAINGAYALGNLWVSTNTLTLGAAVITTGLQIDSTGSGTIANGGNLLTVNCTGTGTAGFTINGTLSGTGGTTIGSTACTIDGTGTPSFSGAFIIGTTAASTTVASTANLTFAGATTINAATNVLLDGTVVFNAAVNGVNASTSQITLGSASSLKFASGTTPMSTGQIIPNTGGGTVEFAVSGQTVKVPTTNPYYHLTLSGGGAAVTTSITSTNGNFTMSGNTTTTAPLTAVVGNVSVSGTAILTTGGNLVITGSMTIGSGAKITKGAFSLSVGTTSSITGTLNESSGTGAVTFNGAVTVSDPGVFNLSTNNPAVTYKGNITQSSNAATSFKSGSGTTTFSNSLSLLGAGTGAINFAQAEVTIPSGVTLTNGYTGGTATFAGATGVTMSNPTVANGLSLSTGSTTAVTGDLKFTANTSATVKSMVDMNGTANITVGTLTMQAPSGAGNTNVSEQVNCVGAASGTLTVSGALAITGNSTSTGKASLTMGSCALSVGTTTGITGGSNATGLAEITSTTGAKTFTGLLTITGGSGAPSAQVTTTTGTLTMSAGLTFAGGANVANAQLTTSGAGTWNFVGAMTGAGTLTINSGTELITTGASTSLGSAATFGKLTVSSGTTTLGGVAISFAGATSITGILNENSATGTKAFNSTIVVNSGGTFNMSTTNPPVTFGGNITQSSSVAASFKAGSGTTTFSNSLSLLGAGTGLINFGQAEVTIPSGVTLTNGYTGDTTTGVTFGGATGLTIASATAADGLSLSTGTKTKVTNALKFTANAGGNAQTITMNGTANLDVGTTLTVNAPTSSGQSNITCAASATGTLAVTGAMAMTGGTSTGNVTVDMLTCTLSAAGITITGNTHATGGVAELKSSTGVLTTTSGLTFTADANVSRAKLTTSGAGTINLAGTMSGAGTVAINAGTTMLTTGTTAINTTYTLGKLTVSSGTTTLGAAMTVAGDLSITGGAVLTSTSSTLALKGNYANSGTFNHSNGTVSLDGTAQQDLSGTLSGATGKFNNLIVTNAFGDGSSTWSATFATAAETAATFTAATASTKLRFAATLAYTFQNFTVNGQATGTRVVLASSTGASAWLLAVAGTASVDYADVNDSNNTGATICATHSISTNGGNTGWTITAGAACASTITVSGTVYQTSSETTAFNCDTGTGGVNLALRVSVNGAAATSVNCTVAGGTFSVSGVTDPGAADIPVVVYTDSTANPSQKATTVTLSSAAAANITSLPLIIDRVVVTQESATAMTNTFLDTANNNGDAGIRYGVTAGALTVDSGMELHVLASKAFTPGGTVTTNATGGLLHVLGTATLGVASNVIGAGVTIPSGGTLNVNATTSVGGTISVTSTGAVATTAGTGVLTMTANSSITGTGTFAVYGLATSGTAAVTFDTSGTNTIGAGGITVPSGTTLNINSNMGVSGDITVTSTGAIATTAGTGVVTMAATKNITGTGAFAVYGLATSGTATATLNTSGTNTIGAGGIAVAAGTTLKINTSVAVTGTVTNTTTGVITTDAGTPTVTINGTASMCGGNSGNCIFYNLTFGGASTTFGSDFTVKNNLILPATVTAGSTTVTMSGTAGAITGGGATIANLAIDPTSAGTITLQTSDLTVSSLLTVAVSDALTINISRTLTLSGNSGTTLTLNGTINGPGRLTYQNSVGSTFPTAGTLAATLITRFDTVNGNEIIPARTDYGVIEAYGGSANARTVTLGTAGSQTITTSSDFLVIAAAVSPNHVTLQGATWDPTLNVGGDFDFTGAGTANEIVTAPDAAATWTVSGNVDFTAGTYTTSAETLVMNGASKSLTDASQNLNNFTVSGGTVTLADAVTITNNLSVTGGTTSGTSNVTVNGNVTGTAGALNFTGGLFKQRVAAAQNFGPTTAATNWTFYDLEFSNSHASTAFTVTTQACATCGVTVSDILTLGKTGDTAATTLNAGDKTWTLSGAVATPFSTLASPAATFTASTSTVAYTGVNGAGNVNVTTASYYGLTFNPASAETYVTSSNVTTLNNGNLTVGTNATLSTASTIVITGPNCSLTLNGTVTGAGVLQYGCTNNTFPTTGTLTIGTTRFRLFDGTVTAGARTSPNGYGGNVDVQNNNALARTLILGTGATQTIDITGNFTLTINNTGGITVDGATNNPTMNITGGISMSTPGGGVPAITAGTGNWSVAANVNFTNGTYTATSGNTLTLNGSAQQTLTDASQTLHHLTVTNSSGSDPDTSPSVIFADGWTANGTFTATTANTKLRFAASATYAPAAINLNGQATGTRVFLRSSSAGSTFAFNAGAGSRTVSNTAVKDSNACGSTGGQIDASDGTDEDDGNTNCWFIKKLQISLSGNSIAFGTLSTTQVNQGSITSTVTSNGAGGYVSLVKYGATLTSGSDTIPNTSGGTIVAGTSEFGASSSQSGNTIGVWSPTSCATTASTSNATALSTTFQSFASSATAATSDLTTLCILASTTATQAPGAYTSTLTVVTTGRF